MKLLKWGALLGIALCTTPLLAAAPADNIDEVIVRTTVVDNYSFRLVLANLQEENTEIVLENLDGTRTLYREFVRDHNGYGKIIDLKKLAFGKYVLRIIQGDQDRHQVIVVNENGLLMSQVK